MKNISKAEFSRRLAKRGCHFIGVAPRETLAEIETRLLTVDSDAVDRLRRSVPFSTIIGKPANMRRATEGKPTSYLRLGPADTCYEFGEFVLTFAEHKATAGMGEYTNSIVYLLGAES